MRRTIRGVVLALVAMVGVAVAGGLTVARPAMAQIILKSAYGEASLAGPAKARGAVVWSHGRSVDSEDSEAPTPLYMKAMRDAGWDVYRLDRMRVSDTLPNSSRALAGYSEALKAKGYRRAALTGQSFGAFISLIAAGQTNAIDAVIATAPAAFGNFTEAFDSYRENAAQLWPILREVRRARVMMFFFHGDDFDPGGRAEPARNILTQRGLSSLIVDQPSLLAGHGAANTGLFVRRFGACIVRFAEEPPTPSDPPCDETWGRSPSAEMLQAALPANASGSAKGNDTTATTLRPYMGMWYGSYINGREVALSVEKAEGDAVFADYVLGAGMEADQPAERVRRKGRVENGELVFDEKGRNILRYRLRPDGRVAASWLDKDGHGRLDTVLRRVN